MKSLLQEAPSVERAISQAWEAAGRPQEFSVKIHDHGKRGFLGFSSKPAVVSITYRPLAETLAASAAQRSKPVSARPSHKEGDVSRDDRRSTSVRAERSDTLQPSERPARAERSDRSERGERSDRPDRGERFDRSDRTRSRDRRDGDYRQDRSAGRGAPVKARGLLSYVEGEDSEQEDSGFTLPSSSNFHENHRQSTPSFENSSDDMNAGDVWETSYVDSVLTWLKEIMSTMDYKTPFDSRVVGKILHIDFSVDFLGDSELSRSLYASLSFVLLQFLKREHKRRFRGLRIVLSHPGHDASRALLDS